MCIPSPPPGPRHSLVQANAQAPAHLVTLGGAACPLSVEELFNLGASSLCLLVLSDGAGLAAERWGHTAQPSAALWERLRSAAQRATHTIALVDASVIARQLDVPYFEAQGARVRLVVNCKDSAGPTSGGGGVARLELTR